MEYVTADRYTEELNRKLQNHHDYRPGMRFVMVPAGASAAEATGYSWEPDPAAMHPFQQVAQEVMAQYCVTRE